MEPFASYRLDRLFRGDAFDDKVLEALRDKTDKCLSTLVGVALELEALGSRSLEHPGPLERGSGLARLLGPSPVLPFSALSFAPGAVGGAPGGAGLLRPGQPPCPAVSTCVGGAPLGPFSFFFFF